MSGIKYQLLASACGSLASLGYGIAVGWASPYLPLLVTDQTPLSSGPISKNEAAWLGASICIGGLFGTLLFGWMCDKFGRSFAITAAAVPQCISWLLIAFGTNSIYLHISRFLGGATGGAAYVAVPTYITEITENRVRGTFGSFVVMFNNIGVLIGFIAGAYLNYFIVPYIGLAFSLIYLIGFAILPETPQYLMMRHNVDGAQKSLGFYRGLRRQSEQLQSKSFWQEMDILRDRVEKEQSEQKSIDWSDFRPCLTRKAILIATVLVLMTQLCGAFTMQSYTITIYQVANSSMDSNISAIITALTMITGSYLSYILIDRLGRRLMLLLCSIGTAICLTSVGVFSYVQRLGYDVSNLSWLLIACVSGVLFLAYMGILPIGYIVAAEILPRKIVNFCITNIQLAAWTIAFLYVKYFPAALNAIELYGCLWIFAGFCSIEFIFVFFLMPETKQKSFEEITQALKIGPLHSGSSSQKHNQNELF